MAKKKKSDDKPAEAAPSVAETAFARGNYAAIHHLAKDGDAKAKELEPLTTIDKRQVVVGVLAMCVTLTVAFFTMFR